MNISLELKDFKTQLFAEAEANGFSDYEFYYSNSNSFQVKIFKGEISEYKNSNLKGFSFRGVLNGKMTYFFSEKIDPSIIPFIIKSAIDNSSIITATDQDELYEGDISYPEMKTYFEDLEKITSEEKIKKTKVMEKTAYLADQRVVSVDYCAVISAFSEIYISNSLGLDVYKNSNYAIGYISTRVSENEQTKVAMKVWVGTDWRDFDPVELANKSVKKAISFLGAKSMKSKKSPIIFENAAAVELLEAFVGVFYADNVQKGFSLLKDKLNKIIASPALTIKDDCYLEKNIGNTSFDSEGVATKNKIVINKGILKTYLHNLKTAKKDGIESTGNGFKHSIKSPVEISTTNFYIVPSKTNLTQLTSQLNDGVMITSLAGLHSGANSISGDFSLSASGYLIVNGEINSAVEQIIISGNFFQLLKNIETVADDLYFGLGTIGSPSFLVRELSISGEEK